MSDFRLAIPGVG